MQSSQTSFDLPHPSVIGQFRIVKVIGEGSTGTVYLAERIDFPQRAAIKLLHSKHSPSHLERPEQGHEQRILSSLDHSNIVRLIDQGVYQSDSGQSLTYLVLEHVDGESIDQFCDQKRLTISARVALLLKVISAVSYAHRHLVVHADLKPSNILVHSAGEPKLLDFSIGTVLSAIQTSTTSNFTPAFASPEQLRNEAATVASDVYTLGLLATLLLSGVHARLPSGADQGSELLPPTRRLQQLDSLRIKALAEVRSTTPTGLRQAMAGDLDAILSKALEYEPELRYTSAESFGDDLRAYLSGHPIHARRRTAANLARKWVKRHWAVASLGAALAAAILLSSVGIIVQTAQAERQRRQAQATLHELVQLTGALDGELYDSIHSLDNAEAARDSLLTNATQTVDRISGDNIQDTLLLLELAQEYYKLAKLQSAITTKHGNGSTGTANSRSDIDKAFALLKRIPPADKRSRDAEQTKLELISLRNSLARQ